MPASNLIERVAELLGSGLATVPPAIRPQLVALQQRLREPVRLAVVGRVNAGKSTLVNALLGQRVAPTDVSECTRLVTWFRYGRPERVEIELTDGNKLDVQLSSQGTLPDRLPVPPEQVRALHCFLANEILRSMTLIDTPGIGSAHAEYSAATQRLLERSSAEAAARADAVIFLFNQVVMEDELQALQLFKTGNQLESVQSAANAVGVLSKADQLGDGTADPWGIALELAGRYADKFRDDVATVVPVVGLVAETSETAALTEADAAHVAALAAMDEKGFERLMWSADRFVSGDAPVDPVVRERLLALLDLYGLGHAVSVARDGVTGAAALRRQLSGISGIAEVKRTLAKYFSEQDHVLKARSALEQLRRLSFVKEGADAGLTRFAAEVESLRLDTVIHTIDLLEVLHDCLTGRVALPDDLLAEVTRVLSAGSVASRLGTAPDDREAAAGIAKESLVRWRTFMNVEADPSQARVARVMLRTYQLIWKDLQ